jgi:polysaccharide biosynthesis transport protein
LCDRHSIRSRANDRPERQFSSEVSIAGEGIAVMTEIVEIGDRLPRRSRKQVVERAASEQGASYHVAVDAAPPSATSGRSLSDALQQLWRRRWLVGFGTLAGAAIAAAVAWSIPSQYIAEARLLVGIREPRALDVQAIIADVSPDAERVQSEGFILQSRGVARQVIDQLHLEEDPVFNSELQPSSRHYVRSMAELLPTGLLVWLRSFGLGFDSPTPLTREQRDNAMIARLLSRLDVSTLGRSHVLSIKAEAADSATAAAIANAFAHDYLEHQRGEKIETIERVDKFLMDRIGELREAVRVSDQAVEDYRRQYGLYKTGSTGSITSQQLTELNSQLLVAQSVKMQAAARLQEAQALGGGRLGIESVPEVLQSPVIAMLKEQLAASERLASEKAAALGANHPAMRDARAASASISARVAAEVAKIVDGLAREARASAARYDTLLKDFDRAKGEMGVVNDKSIQLDALERDAAVNRNLLQAALNRAKKTMGSADIVQANGRIISAAVAPGYPAFPPKNLLLILGAFGGLLIAASIAMLLERNDRTFRRAEQVEALTGMPVLSMVPQVRGRAVAQQVLRNPISSYSEALRRLFVGVELSEATVSPKVLLVTSSVPAEGKSMMVASLGRQLAASGKKVLLIDCDWRSPSLQRIFHCDNAKGLANLLAEDDVLLNDCLHRDAESGVDILPAGSWKPQFLQLLGSDRMARLLEAFSAEYDLLILDSSPVLVTADSLALCRLVEKVLFVVRWGQTRQEAVLEALKQLLDAQADVAGVAISQVVTKEFRRYASHDLAYSRPVMAAVR